MKKIVLLITMFLGVAMMASAQAKKPRLVVIPSDALLNSMGLLSTVDDMGESAYIQNYQKAYLDTDYKACVAKIQEMFTDRGFDLTSLEDELKRVKGKTSVIPVDIKLELNYRIEKVGPKKLLYFELTGKDNYSSKQIAGASGESAPAISATTVTLLQEAVLSKIGKFSDDIQAYFEKTMAKGRETRLTIRSSVVTVDQKILEITEQWLSENCVNGSFSTDQASPEEIVISQSMIPLYDKKGKKLDAANFYKPLVNEITNLVSTKGFAARLDRNALNSGSGGGTLGDAVIVIDEPSDGF